MTKKCALSVLKKKDLLDVFLFNIIKSVSGCDGFNHKKGSYCKSVSGVKCIWNFRNTIFDHF